MKHVSRADRLEVSGDGPVSFRISPINEQSSQVEISIDYSRADIPNLQYDADYATVLKSRTGIVLSFGRLETGTSKLRSKIEISFTRESFLNQVWHSSRDLANTVKRTVADHTLEPIVPENLGTVEKTQAFRSNYTYMSVMAQEAALDFYHLSPGEVHQARLGKKSEIYLQAVVRVVCAISLVQELLTVAEPFAKEIEDAENAEYQHR